jgi:hypothetical protein
MTEVLVSLSVLSRCRAYGARWKTQGVDITEDWLLAYILLSERERRLERAERLIIVVGKGVSESWNF